MAGFDGREFAISKGGKPSLDLCEERVGVCNPQREQVSRGRRQEKEEEDVLSMSFSSSLAHSSIRSRCMRSRIRAKAISILERASIASIRCWA